MGWVGRLHRKLILTISSKLLSCDPQNEMTDLLNYLKEEEHQAFVNMLIECMQLPPELILCPGSTSDVEDCSTAGSSPLNATPVKAKLKTSKLANVTTLMVRNVPTTFTQKQLLTLLLSDMAEGTIDFFYLPTDISSKRNLGYAFVNFSSASAAEQFKLVFVGRLFVAGYPGLTVTPATVQGLEANISNVLSNPTVRRIKNPLYMPVFRSADGQFSHVQSRE